MPLNEVLLGITAGLIFLALLYAAIVSYRENEARAARIFLLFLLDPLIAFAFIYFDYPYKTEVIWIINGLYWAMALFFIIPFGRKKGFENPIPVKRIDERDVMFSRVELEEGTAHFESYYQRHPKKKLVDSINRGAF